MRSFFMGGIAALAMTAATAALANPVTLRMNNYEPPAGITNTEFYQPWVDRVNSIDPDALQLQYFPGGGLGRDPTTQLEIVESGVADMAYILLPYHAGRFPDNLVMNFPFLGTSATEGSRAFTRLYQDGLLRGYDSIIPLGLQISPVSMLSSVEPINSIEDLRGLRIRAADGIWSRLIEALGGVPVTNIPVNQAAENLSRGVIDASLDNWVIIGLFNHGEVAPNAFAIPLGQVVTTVAMNRAVFDGLPEDARAALEQASFMEYADMWGEAIDRLSDGIEQEWRENPDLNVVDYSEADRDAIIAARDTLMARWFEEDPHHQVVFEALQAALAEERGE